MTRPETNPRETGDEGYLLVGAIVAIFLVFLALSVAAPKIARQIQREREVESVHRGKEYVRAIQLYYKKFGHYPGSIEQLEKTNNIRFLRQRYVDPLTGKDDWRLIHVGENKTTVKGLFGEELPGLSAGLGSAAGLASSTGNSAVNSPTGNGLGGSSSAFANTGTGGGLGGSTLGSTNSGGLGGSTTPNGFGGASTVGTTAPAGTTGSGGATGTGSSSGNGIQGGGGLIMGVGSASSGEAIVEVNGEDTHEGWEFLYDPRIEQLKAKANLFGGGMTSSSSGTTPGQAPPAGMNLGNTPAPNQPNSPVQTKPNTPP